jgi:hypothetical protein
MGGAPRTVKWRGIDTDPESALCWEAAATDPELDDILVRPILGYGSYRANAASAGTDSGGGHVDINLEGLTDEQCRRMERVFRRYGNAASWRPRLNPQTKKPYGWQNHLHVLRIDTTDLSGPARTQVADYLAGWSGLPIGGRVLRDSGTRAHTAARWLSIKKKETSNMALTAADVKVIANTDNIFNCPDRYKGQGNDYWTLNSYQRVTLNNVYSNGDRLAKITGILSGLVTAVEQLAKGQGIDMAAITAAAEKGAREGVAESIDSIDVTIRKS